MDNNKIKIVISGKAGTGKTTIARLLMSTLRDMGIRFSFDSYEGGVLPNSGRLNKAVETLKGREVEVKIAEVIEMCGATKGRAITKEFINTICPEHSRTSCSDAIYCNAARTNDGYTHCIRCYLLNHMGEDFDELPIKFNLTQEPKMEKKVIEITVPVGMDLPDELRKYAK